MILYPWQKIILAVSKCILFPEAKVAFVCTDESKQAETTGRINRHINQIDSEISSKSGNIIEFKNGSTIEVLVPKQEEPCNVIRGKRAELPLFYNDFTADKATLSEVLKSYFSEEDRP